MLLAASAGIVLKNNLERIGPLALAVAIGVAAAACYAWVWWHRPRATVADDYVLLLGALLVSADVAFIESQFHLLGRLWPRHFVVLAVVHGVGAYVYRSRIVLSLAIAALASWFGVEQRSSGAFICAAALIVWREIHYRVVRASGAPFLRVFEHFAANLAMWGGLQLLKENETFNIGCAITIIVAVVVMAWGFRQRSESFVIYAFVYAVIAIDAFLIHLIDDAVAALAIVVVSMILAVVALIAIHRRFRERAA